MYVQTWSLHKYKFVHTLILYMVLLLVLHVGRDESRTGRDWSRLAIWKHTDVSHFKQIRSLLLSPIMSPMMNIGTEGGIETNPIGLGTDPPIHHQPLENTIIFT